MASTMFNRAKQIASENIGGVKTEYEEDLQTLFQDLKLTKEWSEKFIRKAEEVIQPNPTLRAEGLVNDAFDIKKPETMTVTEGMGVTFENASLQLFGDERYTQTLKLMGLAERHLGGAQRKLANEIQQKYVDPFKLFLQNEVAECTKEKKSLETKRIDLDVAKAKAHKAKKPAEKEAADKELKAAEEDFTRQSDFMKVAIRKALAAHRQQHFQWMSELREAQIEHFKECNSIMEELTQGIQKLGEPAPAADASANDAPAAEAA